MTTIERPNELDDRARRLRERVETDYPPAWEFEHNPTLVGTIESYSVVNGVYGETVVCELLEADSGQRLAVWLSQTALLAKFKDLRPRVGELVAIRYLGEKGGNDGKRAYHAFRVELDRDGQSFDWESLDQPASPPASSSSAPPAPSPPVDDTDLPF